MIGGKVLDLEAGDPATLEHWSDSMTEGMSS